MRRAHEMVESGDMTGKVMASGFLSPASNRLLIPLE